MMFFASVMSDSIASGHGIIQASKLPGWIEALRYRPDGHDLQWGVEILFERFEVRQNIMKVFIRVFRDQLLVACERVIHIHRYAWSARKRKVLSRRIAQSDVEIIHIFERSANATAVCGHRD